MAVIGRGGNLAYLAGIAALGLAMAKDPIEPPSEEKAGRAKKAKKLTGNAADLRAKQSAKRRADDALMHPSVEPKREDYPSRQLFRQATRNWEKRL